MWEDCPRQVKWGRRIEKWGREKGKKKGKERKEEKKRGKRRDRNTKSAYMKLSNDAMLIT